MHILGYETKILYENAEMCIHSKNEHKYVNEADNLLSNKMFTKTMMETHLPNKFLNVH